MKVQSRVYILMWCMVVVAAVSSVQAQTAMVSISSYPSVVDEGVPFNVVVDYSADLYDYGLASRIFLEVVNADNGEIVDVLWDDNERLCYEGPSGQVTFTPVVSGVSSIYFNAYISPVEFNSWFVTELEGYPRDGTYPYKWEGNGVTHDIYYQDTLILADNVTGNYCYCSGITYQVFMDAYEDYNTYFGYNDIYGMTPTDADLFRKEWYGWYDTRCSVAAITKYKVGYEIPYTDKWKVKAGDDVQLWRWSGSGHSVIFIDWERDAQNNIIGIKYWSTQSSTDGINYNSEFFGSDGSYLRDDQCYYARKVKPVDLDDWPARYDDVNTAADPTTVVVATPTPTPTPTPEGDVANFADADYITEIGSIAGGSYVDTHEQDNVYETLSEAIFVQGPPPDRHDELSHIWSFNVYPGVSYTFYVDAFKTSSSDGDNFVFAYSKDDSIYTNMLSVTKTADDDQYQTYAFPEDVSGTLYVRVQDTDRTKGHQTIDNVYIDHMYVLTSGTSEPTPTPTPTPEPTATPTPTPTPVGGTMHVSDITPNLIDLGRGQKRPDALITIVDENNNPVSGASVTGTFTGAVNETVTADTDATGVAELITLGQANAPCKYTICVDDVVHASYTYDPNANVETCDSN